MPEIRAHSIKNINSAKWLGLFRSSTSSPAVVVVVPISAFGEIYVLCFQTCLGYRHRDTHIDDFRWSRWATNEQYYVVPVCDLGISTDLLEPYPKRFQAKLENAGMSKK